MERKEMLAKTHDQTTRETHSDIMHINLTLRQAQGAVK
jgi:hypothetical protein